MKRYFFSISIVLVVYTISSGQLPSSGTLNQYMNAESRLNASGSSPEGSPYITDDLVNGYVIFRNDSRLDNVPIRYNAFKDMLEMKWKGQDYISKASDLKEFGYVDSKSKRTIIYKYLPLEDGTSSMVEVLFSEKFVFGALNKIKVRYGANNGLNPGKDVLQRMVLYYLIKDGQSKKIIRNNKSLVEGLADHTNELNTYIKANKLNAKDDQDLIDILKFYNSLSTQ